MCLLYNNCIFQVIQGSRPLPDIILANISCKPDGKHHGLKIYFSRNSFLNMETNDFTVILKTQRRINHFYMITLSVPERKTKQQQKKIKKISE